MENSHLSSTRFDSFDLPPGVLKGLEGCGFDYCTEIQSLCLPHALNGKDIAGQAQTGTGKTAAFLIGTFARLLSRPKRGDKDTQVRALILAPTRELALQIHKDATALSTHIDLKLGLAYGGIDYEKQRTQLQAGVDILIGTPGRTIDYCKQGVFSLDATEVIVLDEADRMFDLGFIADIRYLLRRCPEPRERLSLLFSATLSHRILELAYEHMNDPENIRQEVNSVTAANITERLYQPAKSEKIPLLASLLRQEAPERAMVFLNTKHVAERVEGLLNANGFSVALLSGDVRQAKRQKILKQFQSGQLNVLIATDVAARGLHIDGVSHVFNFDLPQQAEDYVHRIGRTARAGASGDAISFACEDYAFHLLDIEEYIERKIPTSPIDDAQLEPLAVTYVPRAPRKDNDRDGRRGRSGPSGRSERPAKPKVQAPPRSAEDLAVAAELLALCKQAAADQAAGIARTDLKPKSDKRPRPPRQNPRSQAPAPQQSSGPIAALTGFIRRVIDALKPSKKD